MWREAQIINKATEHILVKHYGISYNFLFAGLLARNLSASGSSCDRKFRHGFSLVWACTQANAEMVSKFPICYFVLFMKPKSIKIKPIYNVVLFTEEQIASQTDILLLIFCIFLFFFF
jgi:hypothetical protein